MPLPVTELILFRRLEGRRNWASTVVHHELDGAVHHLQDGHVPSAPDGQQQAGHVARLDHHAHVEVDTNAEPAEGLDPATLGPEEVSRLNLKRKVKSRILRDKTMDDKLIFLPNKYKQNIAYFGLQLLVEIV